MLRLTLGATLAMLALGAGPAGASLDLASDVLANRANQVIGGQSSATVDWAIGSGELRLLHLEGDRFLVALRVRGLIIPFLGFNPSPDVLVRVVCHDATGAPEVSAITRTAPLSPAGDGFLVDVVELPGDACFAPIALIGGSTDPAGNVPGNWFAVSGF